MTNCSDLKDFTLDVYLSIKEKDKGGKLGDPSDGPRSSAELIDCKTLQNHYNASFPAARMTTHAFQVNTVTQFVWVPCDPT